VGLNYVINRDNVDVLPGYMEFVCDYFQSIGVNTTRKPVTVTLSFVSPVGWTLEHLDQIPKLSESAPKIAQALDMAEKWGVEAHIPGLCGVPLCILPGYEQFFDEFHEDTPPDIGIRGYVDACDSCSYRERCSGYWTKYMEIYGEDEFGQKEELPAWAIKEDVILLESIFEAIKESLPTLGIITDQFVQNIPIVELADALNKREVPMLKGGRWTEAKCQTFCREHSLPDQIGPEQPLPQWARQRSAEAPPAFVDQIKLVLLDLGVDVDRGPQNIPYHELSEALVQRDIPAPDGFEWNDAYCLEFCIVHGLYIPPKETVGWVVNGKVSMEGTHFWLRTLEGELVSFTDGIPTQALFLGGEPDEMASLESFLSGRDNIESVQWVNNSVLGEENAVRVMRVVAREMRVIQWLLRRVEERFPSVLVYDSHWTPFERYLHGERKVDAGRPVLVTHHQDGTIVGMANVDEEKIGGLPLTLATVAFEIQDDRLMAAEILTPVAQRFEGEEKTLFEEFSRALLAVDPDVVFVRGGRAAVAGLPARWREVRPESSPARLEGGRQRRARTMEQWFQGRVLVHEEQWGSAQNFLEACSGEVLLPSRMSLQEEGRGSLSEQVQGLLAGQLTRAV
jgi:hypothetical protein